LRAGAGIPSRPFRRHGVLLRERSTSVSAGSKPQQRTPA
jgi:hypothetical protein